ncbi:MAG: sodium:proton antiporter [Erysipelotrichaceae bacterium]|nr:sodium:proton antiporter [Erysipelotrichaceae bacterium]
MEMIELATHWVLLITMISLAIVLLFCLLRAILGPRFTDRLIAVNLVGTKTIILICVVAMYIGEAYVVDVALIYALISFLAVVVLVNVYKSAYNKQRAERSVKEEA